MAPVVLHHQNKRLHLVDLLPYGDTDGSGSGDSHFEMIAIKYDISCQLFYEIDTQSAAGGIRFE